jgi:diacylglycerol kinase (ATP)
MLDAFRHVVNATGYSIAGFSHLVGRELAARIEIAVAAAAVAWLVVLHSSLGEILILLILACVLISVEALNTCVELIADQVSPHRSAFAKAAKDLGSLAVFVILIAGGAYVAAITADKVGLIQLW